MTYRLGFSVLVLALAAACGSDDDPSGTKETGGEATASSGGNDAASTGSEDGAASGAGASAGGGDVGAGGASGTNGSDTGAGGMTAGPSDGGASPEGACVNVADMAVFGARSVAQLACEGAACAGKNINLFPPGIEEAGTSACVAEEAPHLKALSPVCQQCFVGITLCVPQRCVSLLGGSSDACSMGASLPNTDFANCDAPAAPSAACAACQMESCEEAFVSCSGLSM